MRQAQFQRTFLLKVQLKDPLRLLFERCLEGRVVHLIEVEVYGKIEMEINVCIGRCGEVGLVRVGLTQVGRCCRIGLTRVGSSGEVGTAQVGTCRDLEAGQVIVQIEFYLFFPS